jgi:hypothetical protein
LLFTAHAAAKNHALSQKFYGSVTVLNRPARRYTFAPPFTGGEVMLKIVLIGTVLLLFIGAIRRWFFQRAWRFILPLFVGFAIGVPIAQKVIARGGAPQEVIIILPLFASFIIAFTLMNIFDDILGPPKDRK